MYRFRRGSQQQPHDSITTAPAPPSSVDDLTGQLRSLEVDGNTTFLNKVFGLLPPSIMGAPPVFASFQQAEMQMVPTPALALAPAPVRRSSARLAKSMPGLTQEQKAQARLAQKLDFIDGPKQFNPKVRAKYVARFHEQPLGPLVGKIARATGVDSAARILLPDEELAPLAGEELAGLA